MKHLGAYGVKMNKTLLQDTVTYNKIRPNAKLLSAFHEYTDTLLAFLKMVFHDECCCLKFALKLERAVVPFHPTASLSWRLGQWEHLPRKPNERSQAQPFICIYKAIIKLQLQVLNYFMLSNQGLHLVCFIFAFGPFYFCIYVHIFLF